MNEIFERAVRELNEEGLLNGARITEEGKVEVEKMLRKNDSKCKEIILKVFWKKLESDFYELEPRDFVLRILELEKLLKKAGVNFYEELKNL